MISYEKLANHLTEVAQRHPNIQFVRFDTDVTAINRSDFVTPAFIISPSSVALDQNSVVQYSFQILFLDKLNQQEDNYSTILEEGFQLLLQYISVVDLTYKILKNVTIEPVLDGFESGIMVGCQCILQIEDQYNVTRNNSLFYGGEY